MVLTGVSRLSKWQSIKAFHNGVELRFVSSLLHCLQELDRQMHQVDECGTIGN